MSKISVLQDPYTPQSLRESEIRFLDYTCTQRIRTYICLGAYYVFQGLQHNTSLAIVYLNLSTTGMIDKGAEYTLLRL